MKIPGRVERRTRRVRAKIVGKSAFPRLSVYRSNKFLYAQVINDAKNHTLASISTKHIKEKLMPVEKARIAGEELAKKLNELKIKQVVFDRGRYKYAGSVKAFSEGVRNGKITI